MVAVTGAAGWWLASSANEKIEAVVATRVIAMLAIQGMATGRPGLESALNAFSSVASLPDDAGLSTELMTAYQQEWRLIGADIAGDDQTAELRWPVMEQPLNTLGAWGGDAGKELHNATALGALTVGDML